MTNPSVTVVIPAFNRATTIQAALISIQAQTYSDWEAVVIDDGSQDDTSGKTIALAEHDQRIKLIRHDRNRGAQAARNSGIKAAEGEWVAFLDSDDQWLPDSLEVRLAAARQEGVEVVHSCAYVMNADGCQSLRCVPAMQGPIYRDLLNSSGPMFPSLLVSRNALKKINGLDESIVAMQEWDTVIRLAKEYRFAFVPVPTFIWDCRGRDRITMNLLREAKGYEQVLRKHFWAILRFSGPLSLSRHYRTLVERYRKANVQSAAFRCLVCERLWTAFGTVLGLPSGAGMMQESIEEIASGPATMNSDSEPAPIGRES